MPKLIGRAAQSVRPGFVTKDILLGNIPLETGELVTEAAITDIHRAYKDVVKRENALRPKTRQLRGMTAQSFRTFFKFAQLLGLVELVREEPMLYPPPGGPLYSIRKPDGVHVVESTRRVFQLTAVGKQDELSWSDLCRAWREGWTAPQKLEMPPAAKPPRKRVRRKKVVPPVAKITPLTLGPRPAPEKLKELLAHLEELETLGIDRKDVASEIARLETGLDAWIVEADDMYEDAKVVGFREMMVEWERMRDMLRATAMALGERDISRAVVLIRELAE